MTTHNPTELVARVLTMTGEVSDDRLREIVAGCEGVTPGPYKVRHHPLDEGHFFVEAPPHIQKGTGIKAAYGIEVLGEDTGESFYPLEQKKRDAAHIARLDPQTVASMASELLAARQEIERQYHNADGVLAEMRRRADAAAYYIDRLRTAHSGKAVRDLEEAGVAYYRLAGEARRQNP